MRRGTWLSFEQFLHHELGVAKTAGQLLTATELLQQRHLVGAEDSLLIDVGHRSHQRTQDQLGVVLAEGEKKKSNISTGCEMGKNKSGIHLLK